jgi:hypothetical protein
MKLSVAAEKMLGDCDVSDWLAATLQGIIPSCAAIY